jgi:two-component system phosphate regulon response regulator OmpR
MDDRGAPHRRLRVLLVDDDPVTQATLRQEFSDQDVDLLMAHDAASLQKLLAAAATDLVVLDPGLHQGQGLEICRRLRGSGDETPLIMLSRRASDVDRIVGLEVGADDFLAKPFHPRELRARMQAVLRRRPPPEPPGAPSRAAEVIHFGPCEYNRQRRELRKGIQPVPLTTGEYAMLKALARHPGQPLSRERLAQLARGRAFGPYDRSLDVQVSRLRRMLEEDPTHPRFIQTVWGVGYVFVPDGGELLSSMV